MVSADAALVKAGSRRASALEVTLMTLHGEKPQTTDTVSPAAAVSCVRKAGVSGSTETAAESTLVWGSCCTLKSQTASFGQVQIESLLGASVVSTVWNGQRTWMVSSERGDVIRDGDMDDIIAAGVMEESWEKNMPSGSVGVVSEVIDELVQDDGSVSLVSSGILKRNTHSL